jgi:hypothetical protein
VARPSKQRTEPLLVPKPFVTPSATFASRAELVEVLGLIDQLHEEPDQNEGAFIAGAFADELLAAEPMAPNVAADFAAAVSIGLSLDRVARQLPALQAPADQIHPVVGRALAWAAMEFAAGAPERHGPWIAYGAQLGFVIARRGNAQVRGALSELTAWRHSCPPMSHSAYFEQRLVLDIGAGADGSVVARKYMPLRPAGTESEHDQLLFETACDDFTEQLRGERVHRSTSFRNVFRFRWKTL